MRLGILGSGTIVSEFLPHLQTIEDLEIIGICGTERSISKTKELCEKYNIEYALSDYEELVKLDIDTIYIAIPNHLHYEYIVKSLNNNLNVIIEKPFVCNYEEGKQVLDLVKDKNLFLYEAITTLYIPGLEKVKEFLNEIGDIKLVKLNYSQYSRRYDAFKKGEVLPVFDKNKCGGALMDLNIYNIYFVMSLFGIPVNVQYFPHIEKDIDTNGVLIMEYDSFIAECTAAKDAAGPFSFVIEGDKGYITLSYPPSIIGDVKLHLHDGSIKEYKDSEHLARVIPEFIHFVRSIHNKYYDDCLHRLDLALNVSKIMTEARIKANLIFPNDK